MKEEEEGMKKRKLKKKGGKERRKDEGGWGMNECEEAEGEAWRRMKVKDEGGRMKGKKWNKEERRKKKMKEQKRIKRTKWRRVSWKGRENEKGGDRRWRGKNEEEEAEGEGRRRMKGRWRRKRRELKQGSWRRRMANREERITRMVSWRRRKKREFPLYVSTSDYSCLKELSWHSWSNLGAVNFPVCSLSYLNFLLHKIWSRFHSYLHFNLQIFRFKPVNGRHRETCRPLNTIRGTGRASLHCLRMRLRSRIFHKEPIGRLSARLKRLIYILICFRFELYTLVSMTARLIFPAAGLMEAVVYGSYWS
jgi:hypothetical protein